MSELMKKAVELADGFEMHDDRGLRVLTNHGTFYVDYDGDFFLDALATQLLRQANEKMREVGNNRLFVSYGDSAASITDIVESGLLYDKEGEA